MQGIPAGTYTAHAIAHDQGLNATQSATVTFTVVEGAGTTDPTTDPTNVTTDPSGDPTADPQTTGSGSDSMSGGETDPTAGSAEGGEAEGGAEDGGQQPFESGPALPPDYGQDGEGDSCSVAPRPVSTASLLLLALALVGRRRSRRAA